MPRIDVQIPANDGVSNGTLHVPDGAGPWPGVLVFTDIFGTRDAFLSMGDRLALTAAGVAHTVEIWPGHHGFAVPDQPVYDEALFERHWAALQALYTKQLA